MCEIPPEHSNPHDRSIHVLKRASVLPHTPRADLREGVLAEARLDSGFRNDVQTFFPRIRQTDTEARRTLLHLHTFLKMREYNHIAARASRWTIRLQETDTSEEDGAEMCDIDQFTHRLTTQHKHHEQLLQAVMEQVSAGASRAALCLTAEISPNAPMGSKTARYN
ncbi:hypothetical protein DPX16_9431 [Anabarilius grahami]|uniref:Uncharacterized protein n=1 Tax=Anabarilius grahami TaxID=495550 RepID=A0A3N0Y7L2_ANAGA|nr:hypothetical protein DPX16_9431 [Anabarilius grahami]